MSKARIVILLLLLSGTYVVQGQQLPQHTQYMFNDFFTNPAIAGVHDYYQIRTSHRFQWIGIEDQPITNYIAFYGPHQRLDMGFGGYIYSDITGPTSQTGVSGSYAYNIAITNDIRISMGIRASILQFRVDGTRLNTEVPDPAIQGVISTSYLPDATVGAYAYSNDFYAGFSLVQVLNSNLEVFNEKNGLNRLKTHFYLTGGYKFRIDRDWMIEPSAIVKAISGTDLRFEVNTRVEWMRMAWLGVGYRFHESISILTGYNYNDKFYFGYSYDIGITELSNHSRGSHELMIGYRFNDIK